MALDLNIGIQGLRDELVKVTLNDTTAGVLNDKIISGDASVIFAISGAGGNEKLDIRAVSGVDSDGMFDVGNQAGTWAVTAFTLGGDTTMSMGTDDYIIDSTTGQLRFTGGTSQASPTPRIDLGDYFDNSGNPSVSHIDLFGGNHGFGVSGSELVYVAGRHAFYNFNDLGGSPALCIESSTGAGAFRAFFQNNSGNRFCTFINQASDGQIGMGIDNPNAASLLELNSTTRAFRVMRMTAAQASAITAVDGLILYATDTDATFTSVGIWAREAGVWVKL